MARTYDVPAAPPLLRFNVRRLSRIVSWTALLEVGLIICWALFVGRTYLNLDPTVLPTGGEFSLAIQPHFVWTTLTDCGDCVLWNGLANGGSPSFAELHGSVLHPVVILTTLLWGAINGGKLTVVVSLALAGIAQWWLARVLRLGWSARLWGAAMAVTGGHLTSRMETGVIGVVLSTASASLFLPASLDLALHGRRRSAIVLAVILALTIVSGQGYLQIGVALGLLPALAVLLLDKHFRPRPIWREFALAGGLALLLAGVFLVPLLHFWPQFGKDTDTAFSAAQSLEYAPLNLVIRDTAFFRAENILDKRPHPYLYMNYSTVVFCHSRCTVLLSEVTHRFRKG